METWHDAYVELMFGKYHTKETMNVAAEIKYQHMPDSLYKYRCFTDKHFSALENDRLYSARPAQLNDIRESPISLHSDGLKMLALQNAYDKVQEKVPRLPKEKVNSIEEITSIFRNTYLQDYGQKDLAVYLNNEKEFINVLISLVEICSNKILEDEVNNLRNMYNVCSFSATRDEELMWSLYADGHKGFCIQYDFKSLGILDKRVQLLLPVIYYDSPRVDIDALELSKESPAMYACTVKGSKWQFEREWRSLFMHTEKANPEPMPKPKAIYIGVKCSAENREKMKRLCCNKGIPLYQMILPDPFSELIPIKLM